jgi:putative FmdB family regulatory protein
VPIYEYVCQTCQLEFEQLVRGSERPVCPTCGAEELDKQFSVPAAHSSGSELPICQPRGSQGCGLPECGTGGCQML